MQYAECFYMVIPDHFPSVEHILRKCNMTDVLGDNHVKRHSPCLPWACNLIRQPASKQLCWWLDVITHPNIRTQTDSQDYGCPRPTCFLLSYFIFSFSQPFFSTSSWYPILAAHPPLIFPQLVRQSSTVWKHVVAGATLPALYPSSADY